MQSNEKRSWQEQLSDVRPIVAGSSDADHDESLFTSKDAAEPAVATPTPGPDLSKMSRPNFQKPQSQPETVDTSNGRLTVKSPGGEVSIPLSKEVEAQFIAKALQYQQAMISEKKANVFATYAMAALSGFSALAIGATLIRSSMSRSSGNILGS